MTRMVSPNEMLEAAKEMMLDGRSPENERDWAIVMNFVASNIQRPARANACMLFARIYRIPIADESIEAIVRFQNEVDDRERLESDDWPTSRYE